jgi:hypothetical protein
MVGEVRDHAVRKDRGERGAATRPVRIVATAKAQRTPATREQVDRGPAPGKPAFPDGTASLEPGGCASGIVSPRLADRATWLAIGGQTCGLIGGQTCGLDEFQHGVGGDTHLAWVATNLAD